MEKTLIVFIGNSSISIVEQYRLQLQTNLPIAFILPHKNDVVFEKLVQVLHIDPQSDRQASILVGEFGTGVFVVDQDSPFIKTKREDNEALVKAYQPLFIELVTNYEKVILVGESSCSFDAVVMEYLLQQLSLLLKEPHVISWCPIQSELAHLNNEALLQAVEKYGSSHKIVEPNDQQEDFLSLFKAYNKEIAQTVHQLFQQAE